MVQIKKYVKKPIAIEALQWVGKNTNQMHEFTKGNCKVVEGRRLRVNTLEGAIYANEEDFIIKGTAGEFYPCKKEIFLQIYDEMR